METRKPYQSLMSYTWTRYGVYIKVLIIFLITILILRVVLSLRGRARKTKEAATLSPNQIINLNIQPQNAIPCAQKHKVKAKISARLANELKTIIWDMSQQILPSEDDNESRILSVEVENLDGIANWLEKNKHEIEVLQPEELKNKLKS